MNLGKAIALTAFEFLDKTDKGGKPYILHCLHVMNKMKYCGDEDVQMAAVMHDLVEDTEITFQDLRIGGFSSRVIELVDLLTHREGDDYMTYIRRIGTDRDATMIKKADLRHNSDITRMKGLRDKDFERLKKYHIAYKYLDGLK